MAVTDIAKLYDNHTTIEEKLEIIEGITRRRLTIMLGINNPSLIPEQLDYVVDEVTMARYSRLGNEAMSSYGQEGMSITFNDNDFGPFMDEIGKFKLDDGTDGYPSRGRLTFW